MPSEVILSEDVYSVLRDRELYGMRNDKVKILSDHGDVLIVEGPRRIEVEAGKGKKKELVKSGIHRYAVHIDKTNFKTQI